LSQDVGAMLRATSVLDTISVRSLSPIVHHSLLSMVQ